MASENKLIMHLEYFYKCEKEKPNHVFLKQPFGDSWKEVTYKEAGILARKLVTALNAKNLTKGDHIGLLSKNCYQWVITDLAISMGGYVSVPYYTSLPKDQLASIIDKSDIKLLFIGKLDKWGDRSEAIPKGLPVIKFPHYDGSVAIPIGEEWDDLMKEYEPTSESYIPELSDLWTILFTSGTTGSPKGVMHQYKNIAHILKGELDVSMIGVKYNKEHVYISYLPLNHVAERTGVFGLALITGGTIGFVESINSFAKNMQELQPTMFIGVPRIWTKLKGGVLAKMSQKKLDLLLSIPIVSSIIKKKIRRALGLSRATVTLTVAAIAPAHLKEWFSKLDIQLREVYGSTEGCGIVTITPRGESNQKGVGKPLLGFVLDIEKETGEIIYKGDQLMDGYYKEEEKTAEVYKDNWYYSGDKGELDSEGYLHIVGRVKDAFKTDKGKYIIPNLIEEPLSKHDFIENLCVVGLSCSQPMALINLSEIGEKASKNEIVQEFTNLLKEVNKGLDSNEKVKTIIITEEIWSEDNELLTPTLKVRRGKIDDHYRKYYSDWDNSKETVIFIKEMAEIKNSIHV